jgi:hypothetical protein
MNQARFRSEQSPHPTPGADPSPPPAPPPRPREQPKRAPCWNRAKTRAVPRKKTGKESVKNAGCTPTFSCETFILGNKPGCTAHPCNSVDDPLFGGIRQVNWQILLLLLLQIYSRLYTLNVRPTPLPNHI